jgi:hypothetical protein
MDNKIICECGLSISKSSLNRHKKTKIHLENMNKNKTNAPEPLQETQQETPEETPEEETQEEEEEILEVPMEPKTTKKSGQSKEYMDAIRQKAIMTIKNKKQAKIDQEILIKQKAEQYDILVKSLKEKEEQEKKKKEEDKIKEMELKSKEYDKMIRQQQRNQVINNLTQGKIIDDIKEQRLNYLMKYLNNPSHY